MDGDEDDKYMDREKTVTMEYRRGNTSKGSRNERLKGERMHVCSGNKKERRMADRVVIRVYFFKGVRAMLLKEETTCWNPNKVEAMKDRTMQISSQNRALNK